jgi:hypothetical protein
MRGNVDRRTPSGYASNTLMFEQDFEPKIHSDYAGYETVRLAKWRESDGTVQVVINHDDIPAYAAALLDLYVKVEARRAEKAAEAAS